MWFKSPDEFKKTSGHEVNGTWYPRVTKILDVKAKPAITAFLKEMESFAAAEEVKNKSAEEGTLVHEVVQGLAVGKQMEVPESVRPAAEAFVAFNKNRGIQFHPAFIERPIWSQLHKYSGTLDGLASIDGKF